MRLSFTVLISALTLSGCSTVYSPTPHHLTISQESALASTSVMNHTYVRSKVSQFNICVHNSADAAFDQGGETGISATLSGGENEGINNQKNANDVEMSGRTPAVLMARELLYRVCELSTNYNLSKEEVLKLYGDTLKTIGLVWAKEAGNTTVTVGDSLNSTLGTTVENKDSQSMQATNSDTEANSN